MKLIFCSALNAVHMGLQITSMALLLRIIEMALRLFSSQLKSHGIPSSSFPVKSIDPITIALAEDQRILRYTHTCMSRFEVRARFEALDELQQI